MARVPLLQIVWHLQEDGYLSTRRCGFSTGPGQFDLRRQHSRRPPVRCSEILREPPSPIGKRQFWPRDGIRTGGSPELVRFLFWQSSVRFQQGSRSKPPKRLLSNFPGEVTEKTVLGKREKQDMKMNEDGHNASATERVESQPKRPAAIPGLEHN
ncbi:hypothetical protein L209DRAFT_196868 [Thermothelomyces heterothallicus CBS 203.75]